MVEVNYREVLGNANPKTERGVYDRHGFPELIGENGRGPILPLQQLACRMHTLIFTGRIGSRPGSRQKMHLGWAPGGAHGLLVAGPAVRLAVAGFSGEFRVDVGDPLMSELQQVF